MFCFLLTRLRGMAVFGSGSGLSVPFTTHLSIARYKKKETKHKHVLLPPKSFALRDGGGGGASLTSPENVGTERDFWS